MKGANVSLELGHQVDPQWGEAIELSGIVVKIIDGKFIYSGEIWEGRKVTWGHLL